MYRDYENAAALEKLLKEKKAAFNACNDQEELIRLHDDIEELEARINYAYQDEEN